MSPVTSATPQPPAQQGGTVLCPRCSSGFECGAQTGSCWCNDVMLDDQIRGDLAMFYKGCLCRACLQSIEDDRPAKPSVIAFLRKNLKRSR
ncbi:MAG: Cysteine-rich [Solirubrobacteraceae bacterium]|jgi:hypothetical protein|nr:Cysteine-rich [Solirubrobacteraceae bacterium]